MPDRDAIVLRRAVEKGQIRTGEGAGTARFVLPDGSDLTGVGRIDFTDAQVNKETGTITQRAVIANASGQLLPGMFVNVELKVGDRPNAIVVPQRAVVKMPNGHIAWVVGPDNKVERRDLVVGEWVNDDWLIEKGLSVGEKVIVDGVQRVQPGMVVAPVAATAASPVAAPAAGPASAAPKAAPPAPRRRHRPGEVEVGAGDGLLRRPAGLRHRHRADPHAGRRARAAAARRRAVPERRATAGAGHRGLSGRLARAARERRRRAARARDERRLGAAVHAVDVLAPAA